MSTAELEQKQTITEREKFNTDNKVHCGRSTPLLHFQPARIVRPN